MKPIVALFAAGFALSGSAALAQAAPGAAPGPAPGAAPGAGAPPAGQMQAPAEPQAPSFSDAEIDGFANATVQIQELQTEPGMDQQAMQDQALEIVADAGLTPQTYNSIAQAAQSDPALAERVQLAVANAMEGASS